MTSIYLVENIEKNTDKVYVGKTINPKGRFCDHKKTYGNQIEFTIIDEIESLDQKMWKPVESFWIEQFKQWGFEIVNKNGGGSGPSFMTEDSKHRIAKTLKLKRASGEITESEETKKLRIKSLTGRKLTQEHIRNIKLGKKGCVTWNKGLKGGPSNFKGKNHTEEAKEKLRTPKPKFNCQLCGKEIGGLGNLNQHQRSCKNKDHGHI